MKIHFIVNPRSGKAQRALPEVRAFAARQGAEVALTERSRHASELAQRAIDTGCELIVAVGGDGTMNEIASALVGSPATLGLIPCGSGDGLGRHLGIHGSVARALDILNTGTPRVIDSGLADGHPFFTVAGLGFEVEISTRFNQLTERGFRRYLITSARAWREYLPQPCTIECEGQREELTVFTLAVGNSDQYGNGAFIAPGARVDDGLLNLTVVPPVGWLSALPMLYRLFSGTLGPRGGVWQRRAAQFVVTRPTAGMIHTDGETHLAGMRVEFSIRPQSLRIMAPAVT